MAPHEGCVTRRKRGGGRRHTHSLLLRRAKQALEKFNVAATVVVDKLLWDEAWASGLDGSTLAALLGAECGLGGVCTGERSDVVESVAHPATIQLLR
eukprot:6490092-Amphidinium_carterae.2